MRELRPDEWKEQILNALEYRKRYGHEEAWTKLEMSYLNDPKSDAALGPNLIYSQGDSMISDLIVPDPEFVISAERRESVDSAPVLEKVDNWLVERLCMKRVVERSLLHSYLYGRAILKIGYDSEWGWDSTYEIKDPEFSMGMTMTQFDKKGQAIEFNQVMPGMPWVSVVHPRDFVVPWGTVELDDAPWCAHRVIRLTQDIKDDYKYSNTTNLQPQMSMEEYMDSYAYGDKTYRLQQKTVSGYWESTKNQVYNELWEIHDRRFRKVYVICFTHDKFLRKSVDALQISGLPFVSQTFVQHPVCFWSTPQAYYLGQSQRELFDISLQASKQRRINCTKFMMLEGAMDDSELNKMLSANVGVVAKVKKTSTNDLRNVFMPFPTRNNMDLVAEAENSRRNAREAMGYSRNQVGEFDASSRRTATETNAVSAGSQRRTGRRVDIVNEMYIGSMKKINQIIFAFWTTPKSIQLQPGEWRTFTGDDIKGDYLYKVRLSTRSNLSKAQRYQQAIMMLGQLAQLPGFNVAGAEKYVMDAVNDPAFEGWFPNGTAQQGAGMSNSQTMQPQLGGGQMAPGGPQAVPGSSEGLQSWGSVGVM
jgi:hypothetical protein